MNHQVFVHHEIFSKSLPGPLPKDRNGETQDKHLYFITARKHQPCTGKCTDALGDKRRTTNTAKFFCNISQKVIQPVCIAKEEIREERQQQETGVSKARVCIKKDR